MTYALIAVVYGGLQLYEADGDPNGVITATVGSICINKVDAATWQNTDGATAWERIASAPTNTITVAKAGGDYTTIEAAIAASVSGDAIFVYPDGGLGYTENNPLIIPDGVSIVGIDGPRRVVVTPVDVNSTLFQLGEGSTLASMTLNGVTNASAVYAPVAIASASMDTLFFTDCDVCIESDSGGLIILRGGTVDGAGTHILQANAGGYIGATDLFVATTAVYVRGFVADGAAANLLVNNSALAGITTDAMYVANGGTVEPHVVHVNGTPTYGLHVAATGGTISGSVIEMADGALTWDVFIEAATGLVEVSSGTVDSSKVRNAAGGTFRGYYNEGFASDKGTSIQGELHVGSPEQPAETVLGEGDSTVLNMVVKTRTAALAFVDVTADIVAGTPVTAFPALIAGSALFIGNTARKFPGWKDAITTALVLGVGDTISVSLSNGAGGWNVITVMTADADSTDGNPLAHAQEIFERVQKSQVRFDPNQASYAAWGQDAYDGDTCYWLKIEITAGPITTAPVLSTAPGIKLHTNRFEVNGGGNAEFFGSSIPQSDIFLPSPRALTGAGAPVNLVIPVSAAITYTGDRNQYATGDGVAYPVPIPEGLDTSRPVTFTTVWKPSNTNAGDAVLRLIVVEAQTGDVLGALTEVPYDVTQAASGVLDAVQPVTQHSFRIPNLRPGDGLFLAHTRLAAGDTFTGNVEILSRTLQGWFWKQR